MTGEFSIATHALVYLAHMGCSVSSEQLAENICTNPVRVRKVMARLVQKGYVSSQQGAEGGYRLVADPESLTLRDVADAEGFTFVSLSWKSGDVDKDCLVSSGMGAILDSIYADLDERCRDRLAETTIASIQAQIFGTTSKR